MITGQVFSDEDEPLIGVNVQVKNSSGGTITDIDGNYSISATSNDTLLFSYIGYATQEMIVGNKSVVNVVLRPDAKLLDEVVVIGQKE